MAWVTLPECQGHKEPPARNWVPEGPLQTSSIIYCGTDTMHCTGAFSRSLLSSACGHRGLSAPGKYLFVNLTKHFVHWMSSILNYFRSRPRIQFENRETACLLINTFICRPTHVLRHLNSYWYQNKYPNLCPYLHLNLCLKVQRQLVCYKHICMQTNTPSPTFKSR